MLFIPSNTFLRAVMNSPSLQRSLAKLTANIHFGVLAYFHTIWIIWLNQTSDLFSSTASVTSNAAVRSSNSAVQMLTGWEVWTCVFVCNCECDDGCPYQHLSFLRDPVICWMLWTLTVLPVRRTDSLRWNNFRDTVCGIFLQLCITADSDVESLEIECNSVMRLGI